MPFLHVIAARGAVRPIVTVAHHESGPSPTDMSVAMFAANRVFIHLRPGSSPHGARIVQVDRRRVASRAGTAERRPRGNVVSRLAMQISCNARRRGRKGGSVMAAAPELGKALCPPDPPSATESPR